MDALLAAPDRATAQGRRDYSVILFLYNTGARADEAAQLRISDLDLSQTPERYQSSVEIHGKGNKLRRCPLWPQTVSELAPLVERRLALGARLSQSMWTTSHPLRDSHDDRSLCEESVRANPVIDDKARKSAYDPSHYCHASSACGRRYQHDQGLVGHVSLNTMPIYAEVDLEMKAKALATCEVPSTKPVKRWREDAGLMAFLRTL